MGADVEQQAMDGLSSQAVAAALATLNEGHFHESAFDHSSLLPQRAGNDHLAFA